MKQLDPKAVWLFFFSSFLQLASALLFFGLIFGGLVGVILEEFNRSDSLDFSRMNWLWLVFIAWLILSWVIAKFTYKFYKYELREDSFRKEHGIIWKKYVSIPYDRIQNVDIYRGVFARILGLSDIQIQTAGGITAGSYGAFSEGRLVGLSKEVAEELRDELITRARQSKNQGL